MATTDPREQLMIKGTALLDVMYDQHQWEKKYQTISALIKKGEDADINDITAAVMSPEFAGALFESMSIGADLQRSLAEYFTLRETMEALDGVRPGIGLDD